MKAWKVGFIVETKLKPEQISAKIKAAFQLSGEITYIEIIELEGPKDEG